MPQIYRGFSRCGDVFVKLTHYHCFGWLRMLLVDYCVDGVNITQYNLLNRLNR